MLTFTPCTGSAAHTAISSGKLDWLQRIQAHRIKSLDYSYTLFQRLKEEPSVFMRMTRFASVHPFSYAVVCSTLYTTGLVFR